MFPLSQKKTPVVCRRALRENTIGFRCTGVNEMWRLRFELKSTEEMLGC